MVAAQCIRFQLQLLLFTWCITTDPTLIIPIATTCSSSRPQTATSTSLHLLPISPSLLYSYNITGLHTTTTWATLDRSNISLKNSKIAAQAFQVKLSGICHHARARPTAPCHYHAAPCVIPFTGLLVWIDQSGLIPGISKHSIQGPQLRHGPQVLLRLLSLCLHTTLTSLGSPSRLDLYLFQDLCVINLFHFPMWSCVELWLTTYRST